VTGKIEDGRGNGPRREGTLDIQHYKRRLLEEEQRLLALVERTKEEARGATPDSVHDRTDESVLDEVKEELFEEAETYWESGNGPRP
jgi:hypothetical protein